MKKCVIDIKRGEEGFDICTVTIKYHILYTEQADLIQPTLEFYIDNACYIDGSIIRKRRSGYIKKISFDEEIVAVNLISDINKKIEGTNDFNISLPFKTTPQDSPAMKTPEKEVGGDKKKSATTKMSIKTSRTSISSPYNAMTFTNIGDTTVRGNVVYGRDYKYMEEEADNRVETFTEKKNPIENLPIKIPEMHFIHVGSTIVKKNKYVT